MKSKIDSINEVLNEHYYDNIIIQDENDEDVECEIIGTVPYDNDIYLILAPSNVDEEDDTAFCFRCDYKDGQFLLDSDFSDKIGDEVMDIFNNYDLEDED